jgi:hypothetical protein
MKAILSHRGTLASRPSRPLRVDVVAALLALLAQIVLPHLHRWQVTTHRGSVQELLVLADTPALETSHATPGHAETGCPICQALAGSHDFLASATQQTVPRTGPLSGLLLCAACMAQTPAGAHAPRGPPRFA